MDEITAPDSPLRVLWLVFAITLIYLVIEVVVGVLSNSLALIADAVHMFTDAGALALAAFAAWIAEKPATPQKTYGYYRVEILAALANAILLTAGSLYIVYESVLRFRQPAQVFGLPMMIAAVVGLAVNLVGVWLLRAHSQRNLNLQGAFYEVVKDALGSVAVILAGGVILITDFTLIDPIVSILIAVLILPRTWKLLNEALTILLEATPAKISAGAVRQALQKVDGVQEVHDLHIWTITSGFVAMSSHVVLNAGIDHTRAQQIIADISHLLKTRFDIEHTTIQIEFQDMAAQEPQP